MPAQLTESPLTCVAVGSGRSLEEFEAIHRMSRNSHRRGLVEHRVGAVYRKQVRRRRAVLVLLIVAALVLLSTQFSERDGGPLHSMQRAVASVFGPIEEGASRALKPARDLVNWFDETFKARGENADLQGRGPAASQRARQGAGRRRARTSSCASCSASTGRARWPATRR